jgi:MATE family multidrug resistance protein
MTNLIETPPAAPPAKHLARARRGTSVLAPWRAEAAALLTLAWPLAATQLSQMAVMTTDVLMLGRLGKSALASAAIGNTVFYFTWLIGVGPVFALAPMIAQALGGRRRANAEVRRIVRMGLWSVALLAPPLILVLIFADRILVLAHQDPVLAAGAARFVQMLAIGLPFSLIFQLLRNVSTALGRPRPALWVMGATIVFNAFGDYALIFGRFGAPKLGLLGAGLSTSSSFIFSAVAMAAIMRLTPDLRRRRLLRRMHRPDLAKLAETFRLGMPIGLTMLFEAMLFNVMTLVMGVLGATNLAAHQVALNVASITFMGPLGIAMGATVRVGLAAGAEDWAGVRRAGYTAMGFACVLVTACGVVMATCGRAIAGLYFASGSAEDQAVIALAASFLKVAAAFQVFDALQVVAALCLRGLKDARAPMVLAGLSYWVAGTPMCIALAFGLRMGGIGVWLGLAFGLFIAAVTMVTRFRWLSRPPARF